MALNKVMLIGNVGNDPEVRYLDGNQQAGAQAPKVATFRLATTERFRDRNNEVKENTEWHSIVVWRGLADLVENYVKKGTQLYVEGRLRSRSWDDQNGQKHYVTEIVADNIQLLGRRQDNQTPAQAPASQAAPQRPVYQPQQPAAPAYQPNYNQPAGFQPSVQRPVAAPVQDNPEDDLPF